MNLPEEEALVAAAQKDPQAFVHIYDRFVDPIYRYALHRTGEATLAEDITSAAFEKALQAIHRYRFQGISIAAWLYRIARNEILQHLRKQRFLELLHPQLISDQNVEAQAQSRSELEQMREAIQRLPKKDRDLLILRYWDGLSGEQTAEVLGCSLQACYVRQHRALGRLRKEFDQLEGKDLPSAYRSAK